MQEKLEPGSGHMSSIKNKLNLYVSQKASPEKREDGVKNTPDESQIPGAPGPVFGDIKLESLGQGVYTRREFPANPVFGNRNLDEYRPLSFTGVLELAVLAEKKILHPGQLLFLDTETVGLNRGVSNFPFMTGLAYFEDNRLCVEQLYLDDLAGEEVYLDYINGLLKRYPYLVSYNGKSFDLPLIRNRLIMNRKRNATPVLHFDLLHILRRLYPKGSLPGNKQKDLEKAMFAMEREDDLPGAEVPQVYFDYKKYGEDRGMDRIFLHNYLDVMGMVFMFLESIRIYREKDISSPSLRTGLARIYARNKRVEEAIEILNLHFERPLTPPGDGKKSETETEIREGEDPALKRDRLDRLFLAGLYRSRKVWVRAAEIYQSVAQDYECAYARISLAKILEHHLKEPAEALKETERLIASLYGASYGESVGETSGESEADESLKKPVGGRGKVFSLTELEKRRNRIRRKIDAC